MIDEIARKELKIFIENDSQLYSRQHSPILKNLSRKKFNGFYNSVLAEKLMMGLVDNGAKKYSEEFGGNWFEIFNRETRQGVAGDLVADFEAEFNLGRYDAFKQQKFLNSGKPVKVSAFERNGRKIRTHPRRKPRKRN